MAEESSSKSHAGLINLFIPQPSPKPVMYWQGIVEIIGRGVLLVLLFILFIASSVAEDEAADLDNSSQYRNAKAAAGFSIFMGVIAFLYEIVFIVCRFLNFGFMTAYRTIVLIVDIIFHGVCALLLFASAVSLAYYADYTKDLASSANSEFRSILNPVGNALGAAAFFAFMSLFGMIFISVWMVLFLVLKWDLGGGSSSSKADSA